MWLESLDTNKWLNIRLIHNIWRCSSLARYLMSDANDHARYTLFSKMKKKNLLHVWCFIFLSQRQIIFYAIPWFTVNGGKNTICAFGGFSCSVFVISNVHWESWAGACVGRLPKNLQMAPQYGPSYCISTVKTVSLHQHIQTNAGFK